MPTMSSERLSAEIAAGVLTQATKSPTPGEKVRCRMTPTGTATSASR